jgi:hypothetical protein
MKLVTQEIGEKFTEVKTNYFRIISISNDEGNPINELVVKFFNNIPLEDYPGFLKKVIVKKYVRVWKSTDRGFRRGGWDNQQGYKATNKEMMVIFDGYYHLIQISDFIKISIELAKIALELVQRLKLVQSGVVPIFWEEWIVAFLPVLEHELKLQEKEYLYGYPGTTSEWFSLIKVE